MYIWFPLFFSFPLLLKGFNIFLNFFSDRIQRLVRLAVTKKEQRIFRNYFLSDEDGEESVEDGHSLSFLSSFFSFFSLSSLPFIKSRITTLKMPRTIFTLCGSTNALINHIFKMLHGTYWNEIKKIFPAANMKISSEYLISSISISSWLYFLLAVILIVAYSAVRLCGR